MSETGNCDISGGSDGAERAAGNGGACHGETLAKIFFEIANQIFKRSSFIHGLIERKRGLRIEFPLFVRKMWLYLQDKMTFMKVEETFSAHFSELERQTAALNRQEIGELLP